MIRNARELAEKLAADPNRKPPSRELTKALKWLKRVSERWELIREKRRVRRLKAKIEFNRSHGYQEDEL